MAPNRRVCLIDTSKRCEPNGFLLSQTVALLRANGYELADEPDGCDTILVNTCCVTEDKLAEAHVAMEGVAPHLGVKRIVLLGCVASSAATCSSGTICSRY